MTVERHWDTVQKDSERVQLLRLENISVSVACLLPLLEDGVEVFVVFTDEAEEGVEVFVVLLEGLLGVPEQPASAPPLWFWRSR